MNVFAATLIRWGLAALPAFAAVFVSVCGAHAEYPERAIRAIIPFGPGSSNDNVGRLISPFLSKAFGQPVIVENKSGAGGNIGIAAVAKAAPDGYTLLFCASGMTLNPAVYRTLGYDPIKEIEAVAEIGTGPYVIGINPKLPVGSLKEFIDYAKKNPGKLNGAAGGLGTRLSIELFQLKQDLQVVVVPYNGTGLAATAVVAGEADFAIMDAGAFAALVPAGRIRALAVAGEQRTSAFPDVVTTAEAGVPGYTAGTFFGLFAPGGTPPQVVTRLNAEVAKIVKLPEVAKQLAALGIDPSNKSPADFTKRYYTEMAQWKEIVVKANIPPIE